MGQTELETLTNIRSRDTPLSRDSQIPETRNRGQILEMPILDGQILEVPILDGQILEVHILEGQILDMLNLAEV